jgi:hypothetical protein
MSIISVKPKTRKKGFNFSNFTLSKSNNYVSDGLLNKIKYVFNNKDKSNLNNKEKKIIDKILNSYKKLSHNSKFEKENMILKNHKILEFNKLEEKHYFRYLI